MKIVLTLPEASTDRFRRMMRDTDQDAQGVIKEALRLYEWALSAPPLFDAEGKPVKIFAD